LNFKTSIILEGLPRNLVSSWVKFEPQMTPTDEFIAMLERFPLYSASSVSSAMQEKSLEFLE